MFVSMPNLSPDKIRDRIRLLMIYSASKTIKENVNTLTEQAGYGAIPVGIPNLSPEEKQRREELKISKEKFEKQKQYPNYCKYPNKAVIPSENEYGLEGLDAIPEGYCAYSQPTPWCKASNPPKQKTSYILLPQNSEVFFFENFTDISDSADEFWQRFSPAEQKLMKKKDVILELSEIIPLGTVKGFVVGSSTYNAHLCHSKKIINYHPEFMSFSGFKNQNGEKWISPIKKDERTQRQKFVDNWGTTLQWVTVIATAISGLFCEGCTFPLTYEIALELGLNAFIGWREWEKGENVSATLSGIFGLLPMLKLTKGFRGINSKVLKEISESFKNSGLSSTSSTAKWADFYNTLSEDAKLVINQLLRSDEYGRNTFLKMTSQELGEELRNVTIRQLKTVLKEDPSRLRKIPLFKRLWFRELGTNTTFYLASLFVDLVWGDKLNQNQSKNLTAEMKDKLDGIYTVIPDSLKEEITLNLLKNINNLNTIVTSPKIEELKEKAQELKKNNLKNSLEILSKEIMKDTIESEGFEYEDFGNTVDTSKILSDITANEEELKKIKKDGWMLADFVDNWDKRNDTLRKINDDYYIKKPIKNEK